MRTIISCLALGIFTVVSSQRVVADDPVLDCGVPIELISKAPDGPLPNGVATDVVMTPDTRYVVFTSSASNLIESDTFNSFDVFVLDRETGTIENVHVTSGGEQGDRDALVLGLAVTPDGRYVAFSSLADNLAPGSLTYQVFLHDRTTDQTELISVSTSGGPGQTTPAASAARRRSPTMVVTSPSGALPLTWLSATRITMPTSSFAIDSREPQRASASAPEAFREMKTVALKSMAPFSSHRCRLSCRTMQDTSVFPASLRILSRATILQYATCSFMTGKPDSTSSSASASTAHPRMTEAWAAGPRGSVRAISP